MEVFAVLGLVSLIAACVTASLEYTRESGILAGVTVVCWVIAYLLDPVFSPLL